MKKSVALVYLLFISCIKISFSTSDNFDNQIKNTVARLFRGEYEPSLSTEQIKNQMLKAVQLQLSPNSSDQRESFITLLDLSQHKVPAASLKIAYHLFDQKNYKASFHWLTLGIFESWENSEEGSVDNKFILLLNKFPEDTSVKMIKTNFTMIFPSGNKKSKIIKALAIDTTIFGNSQIPAEYNLMAHYFERILYNINMLGITYYDIHKFNGITQKRLVAIYNHSKGVIGLGYGSENLGNDLKPEERIKKAIDYLSQCSEPIKKMWLGDLYHSQYRLMVNHDQTIFDNAVCWLNQDDDTNRYDLLGKLYGTRAIQLFNNNSLEKAEYHLNHAFKYFYLALKYDLPEASHNLKITEKIMRDIKLKRNTLIIDNKTVSKTDVKNKEVCTADEQPQIQNEEIPFLVQKNTEKHPKRSKEEKQADRVKRYTEIMNKDPNLKINISKKTQSNNSQSKNFIVGFIDQSVERDFQKIMQDKIKETKLNILIQDILFAPWETHGQGQPEILKHHHKNEPTTYSRRINDKDRLVYQIEGNKIIIISCEGHYKRF